MTSMALRTESAPGFRLLAKFISVTAISARWRGLGGIRALGPHGGIAAVPLENQSHLLMGHGVVHAEGGSIVARTIPLLLAQEMASVYHFPAGTSAKEAVDAAAGFQPDGAGP